ncbi:TatD family deoxyribonuclease [Egibacter rhizosphaerae]|uniref:TatD family deoxyribonuclease n=1 Tax=Egibacter rhizosphaerae TaxID=1670831 RepID=A0A411YII9_9ACTN|nr:TatD family hydrolase [Egibacter rhizosphaerae]QBI21104.1 TatD family deoxyribonuclease [Egibacter rhizosphaerae]
MYTDTHCHLEMLDIPPGEAVDRARADGVDTLVTVGIDLASSAECVGTASAFDGVWASVGIHPHNAIEATEAVLGHLRSLAEHPQVVAIGETGLDWFRDHSPAVRQEEAFREQLRLAKELGRTLVIHCREAHKDLLRVLEDEGAPERTVMHCFSGDVEFAERCAEEGWYCSFAGNVTFRNAPDLREAASVVPLHLLLTETDSPYLSPHPHRGQPNEPARVSLVAEELADVHGTTTYEMGRVTSQNARRAFGLLAPPANAAG